MLHILTAVFLLMATGSNLCVQSFSPPTTSPHHPSLLPPLGYASVNARGTRAGPTIIDINSPNDLKDFVIADDRLAVIKVYANWCKTCKRFDARYRKVASTWGDKCGALEFNEEKTEFSNRVRFAQMEYGANEEMCEMLDATQLPHILIYNRESGKVAGFPCLPSKINRLVDSLHKHALPLAGDQPIAGTHSIDSKEVGTEQVLAEGSELVQGMMPELQEESFYSSDTEPPLSYAEFSIKHARNKKKKPKHLIRPAQ